MDAGWRQSIFDKLGHIPGCLVVAGDPDGLLTEEKTANMLGSLGFEVVVFDDPIEFRYVYESRYRSQPNAFSLLVILPDPDFQMRKVPFDVRTKAKTVNFSLADLFPNLSYPVISHLDKADLDCLWSAYAHYKPVSFGENLTKDFVLDHVFDMMPARHIRSEKDLVLTLMRRHYRGRRIPKILDGRFIDTLKEKGAFLDWPLETIVPDRYEFLHFLQEQWPLFVEKQLGFKVADAPMAVAEPVNIPFLDYDIKTLLDRFFLEGLLTPVTLDPSEHSRLRSIGDPSIGIGLRVDVAEGWLWRINRTVGAVSQALPSKDATFDTWREFAAAWAQLNVLVHSMPDRPGARPNSKELWNQARTAQYLSYGDNKEHVKKAFASFVELQGQVDARFHAWLQTGYSALHNQPAVPPVMAHHVPRFLASQLLHDSGARVALVVIDGMASDQWSIIKDEILRQEPGTRCRDSSMFAWIPTLTQVSRQSLFAGKMPMFLGNLRSTAGEQNLWKQFWSGQGLREHEIGYVKVRGRTWSGTQSYLLEMSQDDEYDGEAESLQALEENQAVFEQAVSARVLGVIVGKLDRIAHGMRLGTRGMHNQVRQWASSGYLTELLRFLAGRGFRIFVTSDHGNIEARGCGRPAEGVIAETRGERVRIYDRLLLRKAMLEKFPGAIEWQQIGLPEDYLPLFAPGRTAFVNKGETRVCHGGMCIEEVIVPFTEITLKRNG
ncbi:MAG: BREX-3 system phosphatase PglZ [Bacillota bacterium]|jgi:hypothetical protein